MYFSHVSWMSERGHLQTQLMMKNGEKWTRVSVTPTTSWANTASALQTSAKRAKKSEVEEGERVDMAGSDMGETCGKVAYIRRCRCQVRNLVVARCWRNTRRKDRFGLFGALLRGASIGLR